MRVRIVDAPGFEDFEGELIMTAPRVDGVPMAVVGCDCENGRHVELIESQYVKGVAG